MVQRTTCGECKMNYTIAMFIEVLALVWLIPLSLVMLTTGDLLPFFIILSLYILHFIIGIYLVRKHKYGTNNISYYF